jgi:hypothetical protein
VTTAGTATRGSRWGESHRPRHVLLLSESAGLAAVLSRLLDGTDRLSRLGSLRELGDGRGLDSVNAVVLDVPRAERATAVGQLRQRYLGPLVVLVAKADGRSDLRPDGACTLLARPFSADDLSAALDAPVQRRPAADPMAAAASQVPRIRSVRTAATRVGPEAATRVDPKTAARPAPRRPAPAAATPGNGDLVGRAQRLLAALTQGWQARRRVRVIGFSVFALIAFTIAFALAAQGRCGPGCDALGTRFSPLPTIAPSESSAPTTTGPKRAATSTTAAPVGSAGAGALGGVSGGLATTTTEERATTTTRRPSQGGGGAVTTTPTTRPTTTPTTAPPTTAPPTTAPTTTAPPPVT